MPASAIPGVVLVVCMFGVFIITLGSVSLSLALADRREAKARRASAASSEDTPLRKAA